ncbi:MAG: YraN family protein [Candidatus Eisenbacteria bacterium]|nr:YraN family protein [Candidatus Eisenbacteria bacterium]
MMEKMEKGRCAEEIAALFLLLKGYSILARNVRPGGVEIDIVALDATTLAFVEVKFRETSYFGSPANAVDWKKRKRLLKAGLAFLKERKVEAENLRFDVVSVVLEDEGLALEHISNAFGGGNWA